MRLTVNKKDVRRTFRHLDKLLSAVSQNAFMATKQSAGDYNNLVKSGIATTSAPAFVPGGWEPLSEHWKSIKTANKDKFWVETFGIYNAIQINIIQKTLVFINVFAGIKSDTDREAFIRACRNEYGAGWINPGRPLFEPAKDFMASVTGVGGRLKPKQQKLFELALKRAIKKVYR